MPNTRVLSIHVCLDIRSHATVSISSVIQIASLLNKVLVPYTIFFLLFPQVFSYAKVYLGTGGNQFTGEPVHFSYIPDQVLEQAREVTIKLHSRAGRFLKLQLYFAARWIMLSEVIFESGKRKIDLHRSARYFSRMNRDLSPDVALDNPRVASGWSRVMAKLRAFVCGTFAFPFIDCLAFVDVDF